MLVVSDVLDMNYNQRTPALFNVIRLDEPFNMLTKSDFY